MEACQIIEFNNELQKEFLHTRLVWHPSHSEQKYRCNADLSEGLDSVFAVMRECIHKDVPILHLTIRDSFVYFSDE